MCKITKRLLLWALMMVPIVAMSQIPIAQYAMEAGVDSTKWITLPADTAITKTIISDGGDSRASAVIDMGFNFVFGGTTYTQFSSNTDGNMRLGATATTTTGYSNPFGGWNLEENLPKINGMGCDGKMIGGGYVKYSVMGAAPDRILVVEYKTAKYADATTSDLMWQVQLYETSNEIRLVYGSETPTNLPTSFQIGMAASETDVVTVNTMTNTMVEGSTTVSQSHWPAPNTFYRFYIPSCIKPTGLNLTNVTANSVSFSWERSALGQSAWEYVCAVGEATPDWVMASTANDTLGTITDLVPNTGYTLYVRTSCGLDDNSAVVALPFRTNCVSLDVPYTDNFESYPDDGFPNCWRSINDASYVQKNSSWTQYSYEGENSFRIGDEDLVLLPRVKLAANEMMFIAQIKTNGDNAGNLQIGYITDLATMEFTSLVDISPVHNSYQEYVVDYSSLTITDTAYIAIKRTCGEYAYADFFIDDVQVMKVSSCTRPAYAYVTDITHNGAKVEWDASTEAVSYEVAYGLTSVVENATIEVVDAGSSSLILSNLLSDTTYYVWVRNICDMDSSMWRSAGSFTTKSTCADVVDLNVSSIAKTTAAISWTIDDSYGEEATTVELSWKKSIDSVWSSAITLTDQNYYFFTGLEGGFSYDVRLRTRCSEDSANYVTTNFTTMPCGDEPTISSTSSEKLFFGGYFNYAYTQMIYPASSLTGIDTIKGIAVYVNETQNIRSRKVDVYVGNTTQSSVTANTRILENTLTKVATDVRVATPQGWIPIMFHTPFVYDGTSNLVITVDDNTGSFQNKIYLSFNNGVGSTITRQGDTPNINPSDSVINYLVNVQGTPVMMFITSCEPDACAAPLLAMNNVTDNSIALTWQAGTTETQWVVDYKTADASEWTSQTVSTTTYTLTGLTSGTLYDVRVGAICGGDTLYSELQAFTNCSTFEIPFTENFDDNELPCWTLGNKPNTNGDLLWDSEDSTMYFDYEDGAYLITPRLNADLNTLQISFLAGGLNSYNPHRIAVEVLAGSNPDDFNTFIPIDTVIFMSDAPASSQLVTLDSYSGDGHYVMLSTVTGQVFIDNIVIDNIPECSMSTDLVISNITSDGATLSWTDNGSNIDKWLVSYTKVGEATTVVEEVMFDDGATHTVTGLASNTEYIASVTTVCTMDDSVETLYPVTFRTNCATMVLPYHEEFEGIEEGEMHLCWSRGSTSTVRNFNISYVRYTVPGVFVGEASSNTIAFSDNKEITSPLVPLPANKISLNFDMKIQDTSYAGSMVIGFTTNPTDSTNFTVVDTIKANENRDWVNYTVDFNNLSITDTGYIVFRNIYNTTSGTGWMANNYFIWMDNVDISEYSTCQRPTDIVINNIAATSVDLTFADAANTNNYTVAWSTVADVNTASTMDVTTQSAHITNLLSGTVYYFWVRSNCSATEHSSWVLAGSAKTDCLPKDLPYTENFDSYIYGVSDINYALDATDRTIPDCWKVLGQGRAGNAPAGIINNNADFAKSGNSFGVSASPIDPLFAVLPKFNAPIDSLVIEFSYINDGIDCSNDEFVLGVMSNARDTSTFIPIQSYLASEQFVTVEHAFAYDAMISANNEYYIAFRFGGKGEFINTAIDDVNVTALSSCMKPLNVAVSGITPTTLSVDWIGAATGYEVKYSKADTNVWTTITTATNSATIANLVAGTSYKVQVRSTCGTDGNSDWSAEIAATLPCAAVSIPWSEDFESYSSIASNDYDRPSTYPNHAMPSCWMFSPITSSTFGGPAMWLTSQENSRWTTYNTIDGVSLKMVCSEYRPTYAVLPLIDADIDTLALYFEYAMSLYGREPISVGVMTNPYDFSTFTSLETYPLYDTAHMAEHYFANDNLDPNQTYYIAFLGAFSSAKVVIDNIQVDYMPSCIRPAHVEPYAVLNSSAKVKWNSVATNAEVQYRKTSDSVWTSVIVNADTILLTGLQGSTEYEVAVRAICGDGDTSLWSESKTFRTICNPYPMPFTEDFSQSFASLDCWAFYSGLVDNVLAGSESLESKTLSETNWKYQSTTEVLTGPHAYINIYGTSRKDWMVTPMISIVPGAVLSFDVAFCDYYDPIAASDFADDRFYILATTDNGTTWTKVITWGADSTDTYPLDSISMTGDSIEVDLAQFIGQDVRFAFYAESTVAGGDNNLHLGNIMIYATEAVCPVPTNVAAVADAISATLTWQGEGQDYEVSIRESGAEWGESTAVTGLTHTFSGLMPDVSYEYRVRQVCAEGFYSEWVEGAVTTLPLPCEKPVVNVTNITNEGATFTWAEGENHQAWEVNVFNTIINESYDVTEASYVISGLEHATEYQVAVRAKCAENVYSDWSDTISFSTLDCLPVSGVAISEITENSAKVSWTAGAEEANWQINYGPQDFGQGEGQMVDVTATNYTITGLEAETAYDVYVRAMCSEDFYSVWSEVVRFTTLEGQEGIDGVEGNFQFAIYPNPTSNATTISLNGVEGKVVISVVDMNGRTITSEAIECGVDCEKRIDVSGLSQGTYFVRVLGDNINSVRKLIVR